MPDETDPSVSVLIPVYNCAPFLDEALRSVRQQTFTDFECVVVNDGSKDDSLAILQKHAAEDGRMVIVDQPNGGIVSALNNGLARCRGEFIVRMDGDDVCDPDRFERQVRFLQQHPEVGVVGGWAAVIDQEGNQVSTHVHNPKSMSDEPAVIRLPETDAEIRTGLRESEYTMLHPTITLRASVIKQLGGYDPTFRVAEDLDLLLRASEITQLANLQQVVLQYRRGAVSQTKNWGSEISNWNAKALRAAQSRGVPIERVTYARLHEQMSWKKAGGGVFPEAFRYALRSIKAAPFTAVGYRALLRVALRYLRRR